jgi:hypothetical protein
MPNPYAREAYFLATLPKGNQIDIEKWIRDTDGMSVAHLRELVVAVFCLGCSYEDTIERLRRMQVRPKSHEDGFKRRSDIGMADMAPVEGAGASVGAGAEWKVQISRG